MAATKISGPGRECMRRARSLLLSFLPVTGGGTKWASRGRSKSCHKNVNKILQSAIYIEQNFQVGSEF